MSDATFDKLLGVFDVFVGGALVYRLATGAETGQGWAAFAAFMLIGGAALILRGILKELR